MAKRPIPQAIALFFILPSIAGATGERILAVNDALILATGIAIFWYTIETQKMRVEMVASRTRAETPEVVVWLEPVTSGFFDLVVQNISAVPALRLTFLPPLPDLPLGPNQNTAEIGFLRVGIPYLAPGQPYRSWFVNFPELNRQNRAKETIVLRYRYETPKRIEIPRVAEFNLAAF